MVSNLIEREEGTRERKIQQLNENKRKFIKKKVNSVQDSDNLSNRQG